MESLTKSKQSEETILKMVEKFFSPLKMVGYQELTEGFFNVAYEIRLSDGKEVILKIAPLKDMRIMTYEKNIMFSEVEAMNLVKKVGGIPVPKVIGYDYSGTICQSPYFFMEKSVGRSLNTVKDSLTSDQIANIYIEVGRINKKINEINCPCFGYPGQTELQGKEWYATFSNMLEAVLLDAKNGNVDLKIPVNLLREYLNRDKDIFAEVTEAKLVHWDCWDGNIFVKDDLVVDIIDWERSIWGDPLMEVGFRTYSENSLFLQGYNIQTLTKNQLHRALWYDIYFLLTASLECEYRNYETMDMYEWATQLLGEQFKKLEKCAMD